MQNAAANPLESQPDDVADDVADPGSGDAIAASSGALAGAAATGSPLDSIESIDSIANLSLIRDIEVTLSMEIGRTRLSIDRLLALSAGTVVELGRQADEPLDVLVNGTLVARGEAVVVGERFGIRLTEVVSRAERLGRL